jgi:phosphopantetheine--protein transferase-like protein
MLGIDLISIDRIERAVKRRSRFLERVFSSKEIEEIKNRKNFYEALAGKFACKEAVIKALGGGLSLKDIAILHSENGVPYVVLSRKAKRRFEEFMASSIAVSISHSGGFAVAVAIIEKEMI